MSVSILFFGLFSFSLCQWTVLILVFYLCSLNVCWNVSKPMNGPQFVVLFLWKMFFKFQNIDLKNIILERNWFNIEEWAYFMQEFWQLFWRMLWLKNIYFRGCCIYSVNVLSSKTAKIPYKMSFYFSGTIHHLYLINISL